MRLSWLALAGACLFAHPAHADIVIGLGAPLTGQYAVFGEQVRQGAEQAVLDLNAKGGINGEKVVLRSFDDACDPRQAVAVANQMASTGIKFVVGHYCSGSSIPASKVYNEENIFMITPASTSLDLTEQGFKNIFRVIGRSDQIGPVLAHYIDTHFHGQKIAILQDGSAYGRSLADETKKALNAKGIQEVLFDAYSPGERDYSALISVLKQKGVRAVLIGGYHTEIGLIARQLKEQNADIQILGATSLATKEFWSIAGTAGEGVVFSFGPDPRRRPEAKAAVESLRKKNIEPEGYTMYSYAAVEVIAEGIKRAGKADPMAVAEALRKSPVPSVFGPLAFDAKGDVVGFNFQMYRWHDGTYAEIRH